MQNADSMLYMQIIIYHMYTDTMYMYMQIVVSYIFKYQVEEDNTIWL